ncbi:hypothetical protein HS125_15550 [bacterium]|nr:hypothetical protein [bacterium]
MTFQVGDTVVKPSLGLCKIMGMRTMVVDGRCEEYFIVLSGDVRVMVPRSRAEKGELRPAMTEEQLAALYHAFEEPLLADDHEPDNPYHLDPREMEKALAYRDPMAIAQWMRALFNHEKDIALSRAEADLWTRMLRVLTEEISFVEKTTKGKITVKIKGLMQAARKKRKERINR